MKLYIWRWTDSTNSVHLWLLLLQITTFSSSSSVSANIFSHEHNAFNKTGKYIYKIMISSYA